MTATTTAFIFFNKFKQQLGSGAVNLTAATTFYAGLYQSASNLSADLQISTLTSITGTSLGATGSAYRTLANNVFTALSAGPSSQFAWQSDALVWTASATMTVKFAVFYMSLGVGTGLPIGFIQLVAADSEVTAGNTVTLSPNPSWFTMSG